MGREREGPLSWSPWLDWPSAGRDRQCLEGPGSPPPRPSSSFSPQGESASPGRQEPSSLQAGSIETARGKSLVGQEV